MERYHCCLLFLAWLSIIAPFFFTAYFSSFLLALFVAQVGIFIGMVIWNGIGMGLHRYG